jgi:hypothetical protein
VQLLRQVRDQVGVEAGRGEAVADLVRCNGQVSRMTITALLVQNILPPKNVLQ